MALRVAVTGASGFIGRHILAELATRAVDIIAVTRSASRISGQTGVVNIVEMDIAQADTDSYDRLGRPDVVIHLAWDGLPNYHSLHHFETELPRQYRFLAGLIKAGLPALVVAGTCFEYGIQSGALDENMPALPATPYGFAKHALYQQLVFLKSRYPFSFTWARLFYTYGEGQAGNALFSQLKAAVKRGESCFNMSRGEQLRDYLPVTRVARHIVSLTLAMQHCGIVNVCSGVPISVRSFVETLIEEQGWSIRLNRGYYPYPDFEPMAFWGDSSKLETYLAQGCPIVEESNDESTA